MNRIQIREPIWKIKSVGLAEKKLEPMNEVEILFRDPSGTRVYDHIYLISKDQALKYPFRYSRGVKIRIIPISDLERKP